MNKLLHLIAEGRFESCGDLPPMARLAEKRFVRETLPLLRRALPDEDEFDAIFGGIARYVAASNLGCYFEGMRDLAALLAFNGSWEDLQSGGAA